MDRKMYAVLLSVVALGGALASAAPARAGGGCQGPATTKETATVALHEACFRPTVARVEVGAEVAFVNKDYFAHNIVGLAVSWGQYEDIDSREVRRFTFDAPGIYPYACYLHHGMVGAVVVGGDDRNAGQGTIALTGSTRDRGAPGSSASGATDQRRAQAGGDSWLVAAAALLLAGAILGTGFALMGQRRRIAQPPAPTA